MLEWIKMPVNLKSKKRLVSRIVGVGIHRVRFDSDHLDDVADAITRDDIRSLMTANTITIKSFKGTSRGRAKIKKIQKSKRGAGQGSKKGRKGAREGKKTVYVNKVRALRYILKIVKDRKEIDNDVFKSIYKKIGGNTIRNKAHLRTIISEAQKS